jgi:Carboxypeptidase regulatory-like domain
MRFNYLLLACVVLSSGACHPGAALNTGAKQPSVGGTIAGIVTTADAHVAVPGRKVTATETTTGLRYDATTATNGGYTIKVPEGAYRIEVELRAGEALAKQPDPTHVNNSDLDSGRDFVITLKPAGSTAALRRR